MTTIIALGLVFAAMSVAVCRRIEAASPFRPGGGISQDLPHTISIAGRFIAIFVAAALIWRKTARADYVAAFVVTGAVGQMAGQIALLLRDEKKRNKKGSGTNA